MARESWLRSDDSDKFAAAASKCEHGGGFCMQDGFCHREGRCFRSSRATTAAACRAILRAATNEPEDVAQDMRLAAKLLEAHWRAGDTAAKSGPRVRKTRVGG